MSDKNLPRCWVQEITKTQGSHILHSTGNIVLMKKDANMVPVYQPASLPSCQLGLLYCLSAISSISWLSESGLARQWQDGKEKSGPLGKMPSQKASSSWPGGMDPISAEACAGGGRALQTQGKHLNSPNKQTN